MTTALLPPTTTINVFMLGIANLYPVTHFNYVAVMEATIIIHYISSMITMGIPIFKYYPFIVIVVPP